MQNLSSEQIQQIRTNVQELLLLDVREEWEFEICHIENSRNIPMGRIPEAIDDLDLDVQTIVICHHGARSMQVGHYLESCGFKNIINLDGGVDAWAETVEPDMRRY